MVGDVMVRNEECNVQTQCNWLSRLTQRLSRSLIGFGSREDSESSSTPSSLPEEPQQLSRPHKAFVPYTVLPNNREAMLSADGSTESRVKDALAMPCPVLQVPQMGSLVGQSRQRLAGHTTRVRLQAPPIPVPDTPSPMAGQSISETPREILDVSSLSSFPVTPARTETDIHFPTVSPQPAKEEVAPSHLLTRNGLNSTGVGTQKHSPTGRMFKGNIRIATHNPLCGSGEFNCGQRDVVVKNPAVRASSVILITLTSNPGPVAVHYVSLLPYGSFTVHLTAPTTMHARFNYMIFPGELS
jgi:hypothetical protein